MQPRGERLNNPFNLEKNSKDNWLGLTEPGSDPVFCEFTDVTFGLRAGFIDLKNQLKEGYNTVTRLITKYAPPTENDTKEYIALVCAEVGCKENNQLGLYEIPRLGKAIIKHEQGRCIYSDEVIGKALQLAGIPNEVSNATIPAITVIPTWFDKLRQFFLSR